MSIESYNCHQLSPSNSTVKSVADNCNTYVKHVLTRELTNLTVVIIVTIIKWKLTFLWTCVKNLMLLFYKV